MQVATVVACKDHPVCLSVRPPRLTSVSLQCNNYIQHNPLFKLDTMHNARRIMTTGSAASLSGSLPCARKSSAAGGSGKLWRDAARGESTTIYAHIKMTEPGTGNMQNLLFTK
jgi:hypothetical protein